MKAVQRHIGDRAIEAVEGSESTRQAFLLTRHYIGRLGSHLGTAKVLVAAGLRIPGLFDDFTIKTLPAPKSPSLPPPTGHLTTLEGLLNRMLSSGSADARLYQEALAFIPQASKLQ